MRSLDGMALGGLQRAVRAAGPPGRKAVPKEGRGDAGPVEKSPPRARSPELPSLSLSPCSRDSEDPERPARPLPCPLPGWQTRGAAPGPPGTSGDPGRRRAPGAKAKRAGCPLSPPGWNAGPGAGPGGVAGPGRGGADRGGAAQVPPGARGAGTPRTQLPRRGGWAPGGSRVP